MRKFIVPVLFVFCFCVLSPVALAAGETVSYPITDPGGNWVSVLFRVTPTNGASPYTFAYLYVVPSGSRVSWSADELSVIFHPGSSSSDSSLYMMCYRQDGTFYDVGPGGDSFDQRYTPLSIAFFGDVSVVGFPHITHFVRFGPDYLPAPPSGGGVVGDLADEEQDLIDSVTPGLNDTVNDLHIGALDLLSLFSDGFYVVSDTMSRFINLRPVQGMLTLSLSIGIFASIVGIASAISSRGGKSHG